MAQSNRAKRGGGRRFISVIDAKTTETRFLAELPDERSPDKAFERGWAMVLLERVLERLQT